MPETIKKLPAFKLLNQDGEPLKHTQLKGRPLLLFAFPKAGTGG